MRENVFFLLLVYLCDDNQKKKLIIFRLFPLLIMAKKSRQTDRQTEITLIDIFFLYLENLKVQHKTTKKNFFFFCPSNQKKKTSHESPINGM